ncbi:hypothetical protein AB0M43_23880 [Longispora sp. NPDC051575]|uniref:hypothetical protein n=1 Tax=Longispora sp. NPDC051575 TaxID=3154943 RepID=UPI0034279261
MAARRRRLKPGFATVRDIVSYLAGLTIIGYEVFVSERVDGTAIVVGMALIGLPPALGGQPPADPL